MIWVDLKAGLFCSSYTTDVIRRMELELDEDLEDVAGGDRAMDRAKADAEVRQVEARAAGSKLVSGHVPECWAETPMLPACSPRSHGPQRRLRPGRERVGERRPQDAGGAGARTRRSVGRGRAETARGCATVGRWEYRSPTPLAQIESTPPFVEEHPARHRLPPPRSPTPGTLAALAAAVAGRSPSPPLQLPMAAMPTGPRASTPLVRSARRPITPSSTTGRVTSLPRARQATSPAAQAQSELPLTASASVSSRQGKGLAKAKTFAKEAKLAEPPETPLEVTMAIRRLICVKPNGVVDENETPWTRAPPDKQTTYTADELHIGARDLKAAERERLDAVFREVARGAGIEEKQKQSKDTDFKWSTVTLSWADFARHFRGQIPTVYLQRLAVYFNLQKMKIRSANYVERFGLFLTATPEKRLKMAFGILDVSGDGIIGARDVFAAMPREREVASQHRPVDHFDPLNGSGSRGLIQVTFSAPGQLGLDFNDVETSALEVIGIVPSSPAEQQGVRPGDVLAYVNDISVETLLPQDVRNMLTQPSRPLQLHFVRREARSREGAGLSSSDTFETLMRSLTMRERMSTRIKVSILGARGLRNNDAGAGGVSDPYCVCEVEGKPHVRFQTKVLHNSLDPEWNEECELLSYKAGDPLKFTVKDKDFGSKMDEVLGQFILTSNRFLEGGFEQEVQLAGTGRGVKSTLRIRVVVLGDGGIAVDDFAAICAEQELSFLPAMTETLTGVAPGSSTANAAPVSPRILGKAKISMISASGLRNADAGKSDPYCVCEVVGKPQVRFQTAVVNDTCDPVWNKRGELEYAKGDSIKFTVFDKDPGGVHNHESLGSVTLTSWRLQPGGFDGEVELVDPGIQPGKTQQFSPKLRVKVVLPGAQPPSGVGHVDAGAGGAGTLSRLGAADAREREDRGMQAYMAELRELRRLPTLREKDLDTYVQIFEDICDGDYRLSRLLFAGTPSRLLGLHSPMLAGRFFDIVDAERHGDVGIREWVTMMDRYFGSAWAHSHQNVSLAFAIYDLDGDGVIEVQDAIGLAKEVERLAGVLGHEGNSERVCEEMRAIYGKVAASAHSFRGPGLQLDEFRFNQMIPSPAIYEAVRSCLFSVLEQSPTPTAPSSRASFSAGAQSSTPRGSRASARKAAAAVLLESIVGQWVAHEGEQLLQTLTIEPDGHFDYEAGRLQDGSVRIISAALRKICLRRKKGESAQEQDYTFEVDEDGQRMAGVCPVSSAVCVLVRAPTGQPSGQT